jgi:hypothetical protein
MSSGLREVDEARCRQSSFCIFIEPNRSSALDLHIAARIVYSDSNVRLTMHCGTFSTWHGATNGLTTHNYINSALTDDANRHA